MKLYAAVVALLCAASATLPSAAQALPAAREAQAASAKSYAVFLATYDPATGQTVGGVAGSAFFVSPQTAMTAFHVLQPTSFANPNTQIWLVHENEPAIELAKENLTSESTLDRTTIKLTNRSAPARYVFNRQGSAPAQLLAGTKVQTDGFLANSTGPILELNVSTSTSTATSNVILKRPPFLKITSVPSLSRLHSEGTILRSAVLELTSQDVNLRSAPCTQVSYKPVVGLSGGPVTSGNRVIGMNSFADPDARASTWAIDLPVRQ
jgi:hypothetical protein